MLNGKKVIGLCLTKVHDIRRSDYVNRLHFLAKKVGYKLVIFNSFVDFYRRDAFDEGAKSVYDIINYNIVDALVVLYDSFYNHSVADGIIENAKSHNVPVVLINGEAEGCSSVTAEYETALKAIINHVLREHQVHDTFFIAGAKGEENSELRIKCYKECLEENGLEFVDGNLGYGDYWEGPTRKIIRSLVKEREKLPEAIFCANDYMAFTATDELRKRGYNPPDDVIITGFDGVPASEHFAPQLTTCKEDLETLAMQTLSTIAETFHNGGKPVHNKNSYVPFVSESCGCRRFSNKDYHAVAAELLITVDEMEIHEDFMHNWIDHMLDIKDINTLYSTLSGCILGDSFVCINNNFLASIMEADPDKCKNNFTDELVVISSKYTSEDGAQTRKLALSDMIPNIEQWADSDDSCIISAIYVGGNVCGYYAVYTDNIMGCKHKIKRVLKTINIAFNIATNYFRQAKLRLSVENAALTNAVTNMPNLKGSVKWFEEYSSDIKNREKPLSVSVYGLPKYTYIYEHFGIDAADDAMRFVAESLKMSNPNNCFIGHIKEDEFIVINYYNDGNEIGGVIEKATSVFYSLIEGYNKEGDKKYFVEVNCGCTVAHPVWSAHLEDLIRLANNEMYMNRLSSATSAVLKEQQAPKEFYQAFNLLIEKNLFHYHFQPIVSAKTGEIYAYEALMRTDKRIGMNPLEVLGVAKEYNQLYDIEKATMFNIMERYTNERDSFGNAKVFINTIPGCALKEDDKKFIEEKYSECMENFVFELTEQDMVSDEELNEIRSLGGSDVSNRIAIDDYGTGHSNIVNLMRYAPQIIKIDRFLVTDIHKNNNKQMFVKNIIEYARMNNIQVLAEGVETSNEMKMVIDLGVDYIQGFYTGRPTPEPVSTIAEDIRREIIEANPLVY